MSLISDYDFSQIKVIGFDLDQTLYPKSPKIDEAIQSYIYEKIANHKSCSLAEARKLFTDLYQGGKGLTGSQTLVALEIPNPKEIVQEALENADIAEFLVPDAEVLALLTLIKKHYQHLDLITGSILAIAKNKLAKLAIPITIFDQVITGEIAKSDGSAYVEWLRRYPHLEPKQFLYIGDREKSDYWVPKELGINAILVNIKTPSLDVHCPQLDSLNALSEHLL
jgi:FMN phosphatase YigB (HAD superfamily)